AEARRLGLRVVLDWVPNHMGLSENNAWWNDVLENGPASRYARFFDIDWEPAKAELRGRVLLPVLPDLYGRVLEERGLSLAFDEGAFWIHGVGRRFPVASETYPLVLEHEAASLELPEEDPDRQELLSIITAVRRLPGPEWQGSEEREREKRVAKRRLFALARQSEPARRFLAARVAAFNADPDLLDGLLARQYYRLAHWKVASEEINYRRFFNVNALAALRMEEDAVFQQAHRLLLRLVREGKVHGLRIDHIDGLYDPAGYLSRLQAACAAALDPALAPGEEPAAASKRLAPLLPAGAKPFYVVVEKVLDRRESLPDWPVHGTVGYDFLNALGGLFVDQAREKELDAAYEAFGERGLDFDRLVYTTKKVFASEYMSSEVHALGHRLDALTERSRHYRDFTRYHLTLAVREIVDSFPVYRTYTAPDAVAVSERDAQYIKIAVERARKRTPRLDPAVYDFLLELLLLKLGPPRVSEAARPLYKDIALRLQQLTGPIMAKGLEDTAFYASSRLLSLNEVGGDPSHFGVSPSDFHQQNSERAARWPAGLLPGSTHDTKRSEDLRLRVSALSELAAEWRAALGRWTLANSKRKTEVDGKLEPSGDAEYAVYQTLLGAWPDEPLDEAGRKALLERLWEYSLKAAREAQRRTSWTNPQEGYERALRGFLEGLLDPAPENRFLPDFLALQARVAELARLSGLSALTLRLGAPGVVDVYQGDELWRYRLVDPDNRRLEDLDRIERLFAEVRALPADDTARELFAGRRDGRLKLLLLHRGLRLRRERPALFLGGAYAGLRVEGARARNLVAFSRRAEETAAVAAAGRLFDDFGAEPPLGSSWQDTRVVLPGSLRGWSFQDAYTGRIVQALPDPEGAALPACELFDALPCALLMGSR
ncbi:MAG: malto-oligosyltrehalose synthase, partial [Elusimicrobia bacterium]|nr:malto-oligosyltrehalose synthase [Elusimicrobiota bacterium]